MVARKNMFFGLFAALFLACSPIAANPNLFTWFRSNGRLAVWDPGGDG